MNNEKIPLEIDNFKAKKESDLLNKKSLDSNSLYDMCVNDLFYKKQELNHNIENSNIIGCKFSVDNNNSNQIESKQILTKYFNLLKENRILNRVI